MDILITGGNGYIAKSIYNNFSNKYNITRITRNDFDLSDKKSTDKWFKGKYFDFVIHTAIKGGSRLKEDPLDITHQNVSMFYNLLNNKNCFGNLINIGSGIEDSKLNSPYVLSKKIISDLIKQLPNFYNIRVFGVFDENELKTRFIKNNIFNYINHQPLEIYQNIKMDLFYMKDFIKIISYYLESNYNFDPPQKQLNCSYHNKSTLLDTAKLINNLGTHKCNIKIHNPQYGDDYIGICNTPKIDNGDFIIEYLGLEYGIKETYDILKK